ncbi:MAG: hypothetical protein R2725_13985 [Solirubrobacterales bacterium]
MTEPTRLGGISAFGCLAAIVALSLLGAPLAEGKGRATHIKFKRWEVETESGVEKSVPRGKTFRHCASDPVIDLDAIGRVRNAKAGIPKVEKWFRDGKLFRAFHLRWAKSGSGLYRSYGLNAPPDKGLRDGVWTIEQRQKGHRIGFAKIRLASDRHC